MGNLEDYLLVLVHLNFITEQINKGNTRLLKYIYSKYIDDKTKKRSKKNVISFADFYKKIMKDMRT